MDYQAMIFNAAKRGDLHQLKEMLDEKSREDVSCLVSARTNATTPLIMACLYGHLDVAQYLIERCNADIEQVGSVTVGEEIFKEAFPLWCASAAGHLSIVEMLVKCNASVNCTTENNITALHTACDFGQLEIAKFLIQHGADIEIADSDNLTCLLVACWEGHYEISKYLLAFGADINRKSDQGDTALHACADVGNLDIFKMLSKNGAKSLTDSDGTTPVLTAALEGHSEIVEYCIRELNCTRQEQVNALELLGSFCMTENYDKEKAFKYWKHAMELRYENDKFPLEKPVTRSPIASCVGATEVRTLNQLQDVVTDTDEMCIQALLIVERIIGLNHPCTFSYITLNGERYSVNGNFERCKKLWMYALDVELKSRNSLHQRIMKILSCLAEVFSFMMVEGFPLERGLQHVLFQDILRVFMTYLVIMKQTNLLCICIKAVVVAVAEKDDDCTSEPDHTLITAIRLVGLMCRFQTLNIGDVAHLKEAVYIFVRLNPRGVNGSTLLHLACSDASSSCDNLCAIKFPSTEVVNILLDAGARPDAVDASNNTPLHVAAMNRPFSPTVFEALVNHGAHLDFCNNERKTPFQLAEGIPYLDDYPVHYINLKCLCAHAVRKHEIVYVGFVHKKLKEFVDSH